MSKSVTMSDIAERLGISTVAVSKALSGQKGVSAELREQVKKTASEMGYKVNGSVQKKRSLSNNPDQVFSSCQYCVIIRLWFAN